jgi:hypothetical protein
MSTPLPMTAGRRAALILGVPLALAVIAWTALTGVAYAGQGSYPVRLAVPVHGGTVNLSAGAADVRVTQAAGSQLRLTGTARYSLIRSTVTWHATASGVTVSPQCRFVTGICSFSFRAVLPAGKRTYLSDGSGDLTLQGLTGPVIAASGSGNVRAGLLSGPVSLSSGSGNISGSALSGPRITLKAGSGNITIAGVAGAGVTASDGSGDIALTFTKVPSSVRVSDSSGNVTLVLPAGPVPYRVNATTASGSRTVTVPTNPAAAHVITVTDSSGNITITN